MAYTSRTYHPATCVLRKEGIGTVLGLVYDEAGDLYARIADTRASGNVRTLLRLRVEQAELAQTLAQAIGRRHAVTWAGQWWTHSRARHPRLDEQTGYLVACSPAPSPSTPPPANTRA